MPVLRSRISGRRQPIRRRNPPVEWSARSSLGWTGPIKTINLITRDNGVGLSTDMDLLESVLGPAGYNVQRVDYRARVMRTCDLAIFLELFNASLVRFAHRTVGIFNLEWFASGWEPYLRNFDQLWAKSLEAQRVYDQMGLDSEYTGFLTRDLRDPNTPRTDECFHLRGHSGLKNTEAVIEAWRRNPDLPRLTIVSAQPLRAPANVQVLGRVPQAELVRLMNASLVHLCPSRSEGWGHYITEGMSTGAAVVTTDASPMNEHIQPDRGVLVPSTGTRSRWKVVEHEVNPDDLALAARGVIELPQEQRDVLGGNARRFVLDRNAQFTQRALGLIERLLGAPGRHSDPRDGSAAKQTRPARPTHLGDRQYPKHRRTLPAR